MTCPQPVATVGLHPGIPNAQSSGPGQSKVCNGPSCSPTKVPGRGGMVGAYSNITLKRSRLLSHDDADSNDHSGHFGGREMPIDVISCSP